MRLAEEVADEVRGKSAARKGARLPPGRGRGSSVSSLICYLIGLSHVDPVQNNLSIDRFLNETLTVVPDIDLDFARDIREELILAGVPPLRGGACGAGLLVCHLQAAQRRAGYRQGARPAPAKTSTSWLN